jgi:hypothetical protein
MSAMINDCIVLKIEEIEEDTGDTDNTIYVLYDIKNHEFIIRGVRSPNYKTTFDTYSFRCHSSKVVIDFISFTIDSSNKVNYSLYNCNRLPSYSDDITIDTLKHSCYKSTEIVGYDNHTINRKTLRKYIDIVGNMLNPY